MDLNLPSVTEALPASAQPDEIVINVNEQGEYFIDGAYRQIEQVEQILLRAKANNPLTQTVVIGGDKKADWEMIAVAMGLCKKVIPQYKLGNNFRSLKTFGLNCSLFNIKFFFSYRGSNNMLFLVLHRKYQ